METLFLEQIFDRQLTVFDLETVKLNGRSRRKLLSHQYLVLKGE